VFQCRLTVFRTKYCNDTVLPMRYRELLIEDAPLTPGDYVFVYGSLKRGFSNHHLIEPARFIGSGRTPPRFDMLDLGGFPGAIHGKHSMTGEVYEVDPQIMVRLDRLEGNGTLYLRRKFPVSVEGRQIQAWIYLYLHDDGRDDLVPPDGNRVTWSLRYADTYFARSADDPWTNSIFQAD
jgi:gamma-glutamylaminecyclotransferase